jgi:hypothetical protein
MRLNLSQGGGANLKTALALTTARRKGPLIWRAFYLATARPFLT